MVLTQRINFSDQIEPRHLRHHDVGEDDIWLEREIHLQSSYGIESGCHIVARFPNDGLHYRDNVAVIINDEDIPTTHFTFFRLQGRLSPQFQISISSTVA